MALKFLGDRVIFYPFTFICDDNFFLQGVVVVIMKTFLALPRNIIAWVVTFLVGFSSCIGIITVGSRRSWEFWRKFWSITLLKVLGVQVEVEGKENLNGRAIYVMNHESIVDILTLGAILPGSTTFVSKVEIKRIPFIGTIMNAAGCIFIDRKNSKSAIQSIKEGLKTFHKDYSLIVFPEGRRRSAREGIGPFKKGFYHMAVQGEFPVVPIGQSGAKKVATGKQFLIRPGKVWIQAGKPLDLVKMEETGNPLENVQEIRNLVKSLKVKAMAREEAQTLAPLKRREWKKRRI